MTAKMENRKKFKPAKTPRYLPGQVVLDVLQTDLKVFNTHRKRVFMAKHLLDDHPPPMNPHNYLNSRKMLEDAVRLRNIDMENKELLRKINIINRMGGRVDSYNPGAYRQIDTWRARNKVNKSVELKNQQIHKVINSIKSFYDNEKCKKEWDETLKLVKHICRYPVCIVAKSTLDEDLRNSQSISYLLTCKRPELRPHVFLDFSIKNGIFLGRIIIELYYDHVPVTVQNFLELCKGDELTYKNNLVHRIILGQYMEMGDITHGTGRGGFSIYGKTFAEENHKLKHTKAGVLSMKRVGWAENNSQFCITFKKMEQLDHKNVVFGNVIKGNDMINNIQYYGRKIGKPLENIIISDCGEWSKKENQPLNH